MIETQVAVAQIAAPTGDEGDCAAWVASRFESLRLDQVEIDGAGNVIGRRRGRIDTRPIAICAHLDTVFPRGTAHAILQTGTRYVGPSITDNSRGIAAMLTIAGVLEENAWDTGRPIEFVGTTGEEGSGDLRGAKHYFATRGRDAHAMVALDGAGDERIIHRALGSRRFRVSYAGPGGHSWAAFGVPNAVHAAAGAASRLASLHLPSTPRTTLSVGRIGGGLSVNSIPDSAWLEIDLRSTSAAQLDDLERAVHRVAIAAAEEENDKRAVGTRGLSVRVDCIGARPCGETPAEHTLVQAAVEATRLVGRRPDLALASTDANVPISQGIPAIAIGAGGRGGDAHTHAEWFDNANATVGVSRALTIVMSAAVLA